MSKVEEAEERGAANDGGAEEGPKTGATLQTNQDVGQTY